MRTSHIVVLPPCPMFSHLVCILFILTHFSSIICHSYHHQLPTFNFIVTQNISIHVIQYFLWANKYTKNSIFPRSSTSLLKFYSPSINKTYLYDFPVKHYIMAFIPFFNIFNSVYDLLFIHFLLHVTFYSG